MDTLTLAPVSAGKQRLLDEAERAFGRDGIAGASLREIAERAGHRNRSAVQYHFGGRDGLVLAVLRRRRPEIDAIRGRFFDTLALDPASAPPEHLVESVIGPLLFARGRIDLHHYARTVYALLHYDIDGALWRQTGDAAPLTRTIYATLRARAGARGDAEWRIRQVAFGRCCVDLCANRAILFPADTLAQRSIVAPVIAMLTSMLVPPAPVTAASAPMAADHAAIWEAIGASVDNGGSIHENTIREQERP